MARISTPSRNHTSTFSQAGNRRFKVTDLEQAIEGDVNNAVECDFDRLAQHFLYLALDDTCEEKKKLTELQQKIEYYEGQRHYSATNEFVRDTEAEEAANVAGYSMGDQANTSRTNELPTETEEVLREQRTILLDDLLEQSLTAVLSIANSPNVQAALRDYCKKMTHETGRYAPYVRLCNSALDQMKALPEAAIPGLREPSDLDIRFLRSDPKVIKSCYEFVSKDPQRKPDVVVTSLIAAKSATSRDFTDEPTVGFSWPQVLMSNELKMKEKLLKRGTLKYLDTKRYLIIAHDDLIAADDELVEASDEFEPQPRQGTSKKRPGGQKGSRAKTKRRKKLQVNTPVREVESSSKLQISARSQCAGYALEMMSYGIGIHHVINIMIIDDKLWVWYYDRQGVIKANGISIIQDLPRFLILLLAFQRFTLKDWGVIPTLNPDSIRSHTESSKTNRSQPTAKGKGKQKTRFEKDKENRSTTATIDINADLENGESYSQEISIIEIRLDKRLSHHPHCLPGRATGIFKARETQDPLSEIHMVCKLYYPEVQRQHEGKILDIAHYMTEKVSGMTKHLPKMYFYGDLKGSSTHRIRSMIGISWKGHRIYRILGFEELQRITKLGTGPEFIKAWLEVLTCHAYLWKCGIEHGDPSLSNMMYDDKEDCGVLTDFDLSLLQWEPRDLGNDRTGTVTFMPIDLLGNEYQEGLVKRYYHHELESFIWIITYTFLVYRDGHRQSNKFTDLWETDYITCRKEKSTFVLTQNLTRVVGPTVQPGYIDSWPFVTGLFYFLRSLLPRRKTADELAEVAEIKPELYNLNESEDMWNHFILELPKLAETTGLGAHFLEMVDRLRVFKPDFMPIRPESAKAAKLREELKSRPRRVVTTVEHIIGDD